MKISASEQVAAWLTSLPPEAKHRVRMALRQLATGRGDVKALQGPLEGFNRLRIGGRRIIYRQVASDKILLEYANTRDVIYEMFEQILTENRDSSPG
jgi:mRNA-degrading endonuclease RelE of RelBE toxin-antitoxin system